MPDADEITPEAERALVQRAGSGDEEAFGTLMRHHYEPVFRLVNSMLRGECSDQRRAVETSPVPVALVNGREEPFIRLGYLDTLAGPTLWHGVPLVIEEAGHAPFWDQPAAFNELLAGFAADSAVPREALPIRASA